MDASYSIRLAKDEDLDSIKKIEQEAFSDPWSDEAFANLTNSWSFVLIKDEEVIGYIFYYGVKEEKSILNFAVRSDFQGMGLGEFLLTETMQIMHNDGVKLLFLEVRVSNFKARNLYKKVGFQEIGIRKNYYRIPEEDAVVMAMIYEYDYLVIGSGIAGLVYALQVSKYGKVAVVTKSSINDCNTDHAQGGIAAAIDTLDSFEAHIEDTYQAGAGLGKRKVISEIISSGPKLIQYLIDLGTDFTRRDPNYDICLENLSLTMEGGHTRRRIAYAADSTGHQIMETLIAQCISKPNIQIN